MGDYSIRDEGGDDLCWTTIVWVRIRNCWCTSSSLHIGSDTATFERNVDGFVICGVILWCPVAVYTWCLFVMEHAVICVLYCAVYSTFWHVPSSRNSKLSHITSETWKGSTIADETQRKFLQYSERDQSAAGICRKDKHEKVSLKIFGCLQFFLFWFLCDLNLRLFFFLIILDVNVLNYFNHF